MKKVISFLVLLVITITLSSCEKKETKTITLKPEYQIMYDRTAFVDFNKDWNSGVDMMRMHYSISNK